MNLCISADINNNTYVCMQIAAAAATCIAAEDFPHLHASAVRRARTLHVAPSAAPLSPLSPLKATTLHRHVARAGVMHAGDASGGSVHGGAPGSPAAPPHAPPSLQLSPHMAVQITMQLKIHKSSFTLLDEDYAHLQNVQERSRSRRKRASEHEVRFITFKTVGQDCDSECMLSVLTVLGQRCIHPVNESSGISTVCVCRRIVLQMRRCSRIPRVACAVHQWLAAPSSRGRPPPQGGSSPPTPRRTSTPSPTPPPPAASPTPLTPCCTLMPRRLRRCRRRRRQSQQQRLRPQMLQVQVAMQLTLKHHHRSMLRQPKVLQACGASRKVCTHHS